MIYRDAVSTHEGLSKRRRDADNRLSEIREMFSDCQFFDDKPLLVFAAGSLGRKDAGIHSDLDLFVISEQPDKERGKLHDLEV